MTRINLSTDLKTRTGAPDKDARLKNCYVEVRGDQSAVRRRASCQSDGDVIVAGTAQGGIGVTINGTDLVVTVNGDDIVMGSGSIGGGGGYIGTQPVSLADPNVSDINWMLLIPYCDEADILASYPTDDKGTSVFAGPAETAYTVPQTTATRTIHGETPCGQLLIKTVTKTYSARSEANQWKTEGDWIGNKPYGVEQFQPASMGRYSIVYASSSAAGRQALIDDGVAHAIPSCTFEGRTYTLPIGATLNQQPAAISHTGEFGYYTYTCSWTQTQLTLYYIDIHEVWTYSVI